MERYGFRVDVEAGEALMEVSDAGGFEAKVAEAAAEVAAGAAYSGDGPLDHTRAQIALATQDDVWSVVVAGALQRDPEAGSASRTEAGLKLGRIVQSMRIALGARGIPHAQVRGVLLESRTG